MVDIKVDKSHLERLWVAAGLASAIARFIPLPLVESVIDERAKRYAISKTLEFHGRSYGEEKLPELYGGVSGISNWVFERATKIPFKLLIYPFRKIAKIVTAATGVPNDFAHTFLLARAVDKSIEIGVLGENHSESELSEIGRKIRTSFDRAYGEIDDILLKSVSNYVRNETKSLSPTVTRAILKITGNNLPEKKLQKQSAAMSSALPSSTLDSSVTHSLSLSNLVDDFDALFTKKINAITPS